MLILSKWKKKSTGILEETQRNIAGQTIAVGELVKIRRSNDDPCLIDITSISKPKRTIRNVAKNCVRIESNT